MLYDTTADVIRKALRGLAMAPSEAAAKAGLDEKAVIAASRGSADPALLMSLAPALGLNREALAGLPRYVPPDDIPNRIIRLELPFDDETVNAWLVSDGEGGHLLFDTGDGRDDVRQALDQRGVHEVAVLITHLHGDHTGGLTGLRGLTVSVAGPGSAAAPVPGNTIRRGGLTLRIIALSGHCPGALGYVIEGLSVPVCVTGDALFAGSIGGCAPGEPYRQALAALRGSVMTLPDETILLPGHGPATTVASERMANPFLAG